MLKDADVRLYKGNVLKVANEKNLNSNIIFQAWKSLFANRNAITIYEGFVKILMLVV